MSKYDTFNFMGIIKRLTESELVLPKQGIEAHFQTRLQP